MTTDTKTVKTRLCIISDTHDVVPKPSKATQYAFREPLPPSDVLLHCGDLTKVGYETEYKGILDFLKTAPAELKVVIAGNHDITLHEDFYNSGGKKKHGRRPENVQNIKEMWTGEEAKKHNIVYLEEGVKEFVLKNGARFTVYSSPWQPAYYDWAFAYPRTTDRYNPSPKLTLHQAENPVPNHPAIDIILTHGPPKGILDTTYSGGEDVGCDHLRRAVERCKPRLHCFGHIHEGWGAERMDWGSGRSEKVEIDTEKMVKKRSAFVDLSQDGRSPLKWGQETLFVNASIMNVFYRPENAPWIVDLELPTQSSKMSDRSSSSDDLANYVIYSKDSANKDQAAAITSLLNRLVIDNSKIHISDTDTLTLFWAVPLSSDNAQTVGRDPNVSLAEPSYQYWRTLAY